MFVPVLCVFAGCPGKLTSKSLESTLCLWSDLSGDAKRCRQLCRLSSTGIPSFVVGPVISLVCTLFFARTPWLKIPGSAERFSLETVLAVPGLCCLAVVANHRVWPAKSFGRPVGSGLPIAWPARLLLFLFLPPGCPVRSCIFQFKNVVLFAPCV